MKRKKITATYIALMLVLVIFISINTYAVSMTDYTALKFGKVADAGTNTVTVSGKGFLGTTTTQGPDYASAALYKTPVDPKNFECVLTFINDYGQGEGSQSGWYAINFSKTANWFSPVKAVIQNAVISGVTIIFKLNPNNKKELTMELSRYSPGSGFVNVFGNSIIKTLRSDWTCNLSIKNGVLSVDGSEVLDLGDAFDLAIGSGKTAYLGVGGFSENHYDIKMNINFAGYTPQATPIPTQKASGTTSSKSVGTSASSTYVYSFSTSSTVNDSLNSSRDNSTGSDMTSGFISDENISTSDDSSEINSQISNESQLDLTSATSSNSTKKAGINTGLVIAGIILLIAIGGGSLLYFKKFKSKR